MTTNDDNNYPSRAETKVDRAAKNWLRERLMTGYMDALISGDFRKHQQASLALHKLLEHEEKLGDQVALGTVDRVLDLRRRGYSIYDIEKLVRISREMIKGIVKDGRHKVSMHSREVEVEQIDGAMTYSVTRKET